MLEWELKLGGVSSTIRLVLWYSTSRTALSLTYSVCARADAECTRRMLLPSRDAAEVAGTPESMLSRRGGGRF